MNVIQAIVLGVIQGLTEFIPISSSAHLVILPWLLHWKTPGLVFDVSLHLGTLFALIAYFGREWYGMVKAYVRPGAVPQAGGRDPAPGPPGIMLWPVVFACVPACLAGVLFEQQADHLFRSPAIVGAMMIVLGVFLMLADRLGKKTRPMHSVRMRDWVIIGIAQALAIIPGVSRSGITITAGLFCGLQRESAARFSFLIGAPVIFAAAIYELRDVFLEGLSPAEMAPFLLGILTSTAVGYVCIRFLIEYLKKRSVGLFVAYRLVFGTAVIILYGLGV